MAWPPAAHPFPDPPAAASGRPWARGAAGLTRLIARARRVVLLRRRALAALLVAVAVLAGLRALAPPPPTTTAVPVAARDLPAGAPLEPGDVETRELAPAAVPDGALTRSATLGRTLAAPVRRGEPLTDARLTGPALLRGYPDRTAVPVRITDPDVAALLRVGDEVEVLAVDGRGGEARTVAVARVAGLPRPADGPVTGATPPGRLVLLAATPSGARALVSAAVRHYLTVVWSG